MENLRKKKMSAWTWQINQNEMHYYIVELNLPFLHVFHHRDETLYRLFCRITGLFILWMLLLLIMAVVKNKKNKAFVQRALQESSIIINRLQTNIMLQPTRQKKNQSVTSRSAKWNILWVSLQKCQQFTIRPGPKGFLDFG